MNYYKVEDKYCFSFNNYDYIQIGKSEFEKESKEIYFLFNGEIGKDRNLSIISDVKELNIKKESIRDLSLLNLNKEIKVSDFIKEKIRFRKVISVNMIYGLKYKKKESISKKVNVLGLGDVGGTLAIGLRLLGKDIIKEIGIYDLSEDRMKRYEMELNQIVFPNDSDLPEISIVDSEELFDCDVFVFTASKFVPKVGNEAKDVRMIQYQANKKIVGIYAKMARDFNFKGIFAVVSDPVDLLCNEVYYSSNTNKDGIFDNKGLLPNQVRGFGLGVMNGRANYYSKKMGINYKENGRVFGPHGEGLIVADNILNYDSLNSNILTKKVIEANLRVRDTGFKPYIAPALSSGVLSIIETLNGNFNYSTVFIDGIYWGVRNKFINGGIEIERLEISEKLINKIEKSYNNLRRQYEEN